MIKLLEKGIAAVRALPPERQDMAGELLLSIASQEPQYRLTPDQIDVVADIIVIPGVYHGAQLRPGQETL